MCVYIIYNIIFRLLESASVYQAWEVRMTLNAVNVPWAATILSLALDAKVHNN